MGNKTKIEWCDTTWNPITGCFHECEYCYARKIARRFGDYMPEEVREIYDLNHKTYSKYPYQFNPTFHHYRLEEPQKWTKPRTVFVGSIAD